MFLDLLADALAAKAFEALCEDTGKVEARETAYVDVLNRLTLRREKLVWMGTRSAERMQARIWDMLDSTGHNRTS